MNIFSFHHYGKWLNTVVDNRLPMTGMARVGYEKALKKAFLSKLNYSDEIDFWIPLLEKSFAKFCGSYEDINNQNGRIGFGFIFDTVNTMQL